jgi:hypothetical protein
MILNVDGSSISNSGVSGFRGLIRNSDGAWAHGFAGNIEFFNILHAELLEVYHVLVLAWELDTKNLRWYSGYRNQFNIDIRISIQSGSNQSLKQQERKIKFTEESILWEKKNELNRVIFFVKKNSDN